MRLRARGGRCCALRKLGEWVQELVAADREAVVPDSHLHLGPGLGLPVSRKLLEHSIDLFARRRPVAHGVLPADTFHQTRAEVPRRIRAATG